MKQATPTKPRTKTQDRTQQEKPDRTPARSRAAAVAALKQNAIRDSARLIKTSEPGLQGMKQLVRYHKMLKAASRTDQAAIIIEELAHWYRTVERSRAAGPRAQEERAGRGQQMNLGQQIEPRPLAPQKDNPPEQQAEGKPGRVGEVIRRIRRKLRPGKRA